jgi:hypothetical protein
VMSVPQRVIKQSVEGPEIIPEEYRKNLEWEPVLSSEDPKLYWRHVALIADEKAPKGYLDWCDVKELADAEWEKARMKRLQPRLIDNEMASALAVLLGKTEEEDLFEAVKADSNEALARRWREGDAEAIEAVEEKLVKCGFAYDSITAEALAARIDLHLDCERLKHGLTIRRERTEALLEARTAMRRARAADDPGGPSPSRPQLSRPDLWSIKS